jgi:hypothetical protein
MHDILIYNETDYNLPTWVINQIKLDAIEYFGDDVLSIRIRSGIERHAFNAKTREVRFAFFLSDYELDQLSVSIDADSPGNLHNIKGINGAYDDLIAPEFDDDEDEAVLAIIDDDLEGISTEDDLDLQVLDADFNEIDTSDFEFFDEEPLDL